MNKKELTSKDYQLFLLKSLAWLFLAWSGFALALAGVFYAWIIWALAAGIGIWLTKLAISKKIPLKISFEMWLAGSLFFLVVIIFSAFSTPTVFSGRDQGSISEAAARLAQNHTLQFSTPASDAFFKIYGPGKALNFPGFYYTSQGKLITQFPIAYIVWLALFYALLGTTGFIVANAVLAYTFLLSFYLLARLFLKTKYATAIMLFTVTSFVFMWFSKFTLSENMALAVAWLAILSLVLFLKKQSHLNYAVFWGSTLLLFFTRIEGIALLAMGIIILSSDKGARAYIKKNYFYGFVLPVIFFFLAACANTLLDINFYREVAKALLPSLSSEKTESLGQIMDYAAPTSYFYTEKIFYLYGMLGFFIFGAIGIAFHVWKKEWLKLIPFFFVAPTFVYFFNSHISPDHPWMLRRFMFTLLPVTIFYTGLLLGHWHQWAQKNKKSIWQKSLPVVIIILLISFNLPAFSKFLTFFENKGLLEQTQAVADKFSSHDLILIDSQSSGDGWNMLAGPMGFLYGKNAAYFFNTNDLAKLDLSPFENVYLIAPNSQIPYYVGSAISSRMTPVDEYSLSTPRLSTDSEITLSQNMLPQKKNISVAGKIFKISN